ncbi:glutathione S-transferase C-terminal domain-containing protein [Streptomyces sp. NRRL B-24484]|uniref:glutathione S-transferase C-terminal domain-containing protein n=1 Tax=Streptomyces sp. NRRL B-24484 TaxID=1463833 RepID=UPI0005B93ED6|nr:glutathione S-transferase C-terminal domain-containing protein [Streptomyces sp. NRRL B-24484]
MSATFPSAVPSFRGRIGHDARSGYSAVPHRYRLHLARSCPDCLRIAVTHSLLGLDETLPIGWLPALPDGGDGGYRALRPLYEASSHGYRGPAAAPVLSDDWSGRIVSTDSSAILTDLAHRFDRDGANLRPPADGAAVEAVALLCARGLDAPAQRAGLAGTAPAEREAALRNLLDGLGAIERRLADRSHLLDDGPTLADVQVWASLVELDTVHRWHLTAAAVDRVADHPRVWEYARRLARHPAFGRHLDLEGIDRRHRARCRGEEDAGAAMPIVDWAQYARPRAAVSG